MMKFITSDKQELEISLQLFEKIEILKNLFKGFLNIFVLK